MGSNGCPHLGLGDLSRWDLWIASLLVTFCACARICFGYCTRHLRWICLLKLDGGGKTRCGGVNEVNFAALKGEF